MLLVLISSGVLVVLLIGATASAWRRRSSSGAAGPQRRPRRAGAGRASPLRGPDRSVVVRDLTWNSGTAQLLHLEETTDQLVVDCVVVRDHAGDGGPSVTPLGTTTTLGLRRPDAVSSTMTAQRRLREWARDGAVLRIELGRETNRPRITLHDETCSAAFDVVQMS